MMHGVFEKRCDTSREAIAEYAKMLQRNPGAFDTTIVRVPTTECEGFDCDGKIVGYGLMLRAVGDDGMMYEQRINSNVVKPPDPDALVWCPVVYLLIEIR